MAVIPLKTDCTSIGKTDYSYITPVRAAFADREKIVKVWSVVVALAAVVAGVVVAARVVVVALVVATLAVVPVSPLTLYRPSATVLMHFVLKLISIWK